MSISGELKFPLYQVRKYESIFQEGKYRVIQTARNRYVLDIESTKPTYSERRLEILADQNKPYDIYPLNKRVNTLEQMLKLGSSLYINNLGKLVKWSKSKGKYYKVFSSFITECRRNQVGEYLFRCKHSTKQFRTKEYVDKGHYCRFVEFGVTTLLLDVSEVDLGATRVMI